MKLMVLDGNSLVNRAFFGIKLLTTKDGRYTNAIYGFQNILLNLLAAHKPDAVAIAWDERAPTFRHTAYDGYKATRHGMPEELAQQMGESPATIQRYKTLNKLVPELQDLVDEGKIPVNTGADIAQMKPKEQKVLADAIQKEAKVPSGTKAKELKKESQAGSLTTEKIVQAVAPTKREEMPPLKVTMLEEDLRPFFPDKRTTIPDVKQGILEGLKLRQTVMERQKAKAAAGKTVKKAETPTR